MVVHPGGQDLFLYLSEVVGVVAIDTLVIRETLDPVPDHGNLLL